MSVLATVYPPLKNLMPSPSSATKTAIDACERIIVISETIRGKTITFIRLYEIGNVEQALHGAVLGLSHTLCVNIIVHSDFKCNCSDLTCLIREDITSHGCRCNKVFLRGHGVILDEVLSQTTILNSLCCSEVSVLGLGELTAAFPALKIDRMLLIFFYRALSGAVCICEVVAIEMRTLHIVEPNLLKAVKSPGSQNSVLFFKLHVSLRE